MASHKSAQKSIRKTIKQHAVNQNRLSRIRTFIKKLERAIVENTTQESISTAFSKMQKEIMKGVGKKVFHKNAAARKISRISRKIKQTTDAKAN
ncbi:MAG: 30S ribosomal protein S20 [Holosporales bacterium]|jgi:small subunit ribosomal protein S20|nr:30S ribosomal protein S20 [Holosporales bacterium]